MVGVYRTSYCVMDHLRDAMGVIGVVSSCMHEVWRMLQATGWLREGVA